jgi:hypothetical protein
LLRSPPVSAHFPEPVEASFDPYADRRHDAHFAGHPQQKVDFVDLLDDDEDGVAELLPHQRETDELLVLVAVTDDDVVGTLAEREDSLELGLAADFEADSVRATEVEDLLDDVTLLIHLDRVYRGIPTFVLELVDRLLEAEASDSTRVRRMSEKRRRSGSETPCAARSCASS